MIRLKSIHLLSIALSAALGPPAVGQFKQQGDVLVGANGNEAHRVRQ